MLIVLRLAELGLELGADLIQQLVEALRTGDSGRSTSSHAAMRVHGHLCDTSVDFCSDGRQYFSGMKQQQGRQNFEDVSEFNDGLFVGYE